MDHIEPKLRRVARGARAFWRHLSTPKRVVLVGSTAIVIGLAVFGVWRHWVAPMLA